MNVKYFPIKYFVQKWYFKSQHLPKTPKYLYHKNRIISIDFTLKNRLVGRNQKIVLDRWKKTILTVIYLFSSWKRKKKYSTSTVKSKIERELLFFFMVPEVPALWTTVPIIAILMLTH